MASERCACALLATKINALKDTILPALHLMYPPYVWVLSDRIGSNNALICLAILKYTINVCLTSYFQLSSTLRTMGAPSLRLPSKQLC